MPVRACWGFRWEQVFTEGIMKNEKSTKKSHGKNQPAESIQPLVPVAHSRQTDIIGLAAIVLLGIILYANSFKVPFHFDDKNSIVNNIAIRNLSDINTIWNYNHNRFVAYYSFALNYHFDKINVWGYHLFNLLVHLINACLVWRLTLLLLSTPAMKDQAVVKHKNMLALLIALLFVSHPLATQSVTYIVQRTASLAAMFYLLSLLCYIWARLSEKSNASKLLLFAGSFVAAITAIHTKENAYTLPLVILLCEACFLYRKPVLVTSKNRFYFILTALLVGGLMILLISRSSVVKPLAADAFNNFQVITPLHYLFTQFSVIVKYIGLLLLPLHQNLDYDYPLSTSFFELRTCLSFLLLLALLTAGVLLFKRYRMLSFGIFWFFITLSIESSIIPISDLVVEHRTYLPSYGFFLVLVFGIYSLGWEKYKNGALVLLTLIIGSNAILTYQRNKVWNTELKLWSDVVSKSPNKPRAIASRGDAYKSLKQWPNAIADYSKAIDMQPTYVDAYGNLSTVYMETGQWQNVVNVLSKAINNVPTYADAYYNRAFAYGNLGQNDKAIADYSKTIELDPTYLKAYANRGNLFKNVNKFEEALKDYNKAIELKPDYANMYNNRGLIYMEQKKNAEALMDFNKAIELNPELFLAFQNRGNLLYDEKKYADAISNYSKVIALKPDYAGAYYTRALAAYFSGNKEAACQDMQQAVKLGNKSAVNAVKEICQ